MNRTAIFSTIDRVCGLTYTGAKVFSWLFGTQLAVLFVLATAAGAPLTSLSGPGIRFAATLTIVIFAPRAFAAVLGRIVPHYRKI